jgi:hypothetical protein
MARITITDLRLDIALDRQAMRAIAGGSRSGLGWPRAATVGPTTRERLVDYPPGCRRHDEPAAADVARLT